MKNFLILIIFFIVAVFAFFVSRYLYSFPLFYEHEKITFNFGSTMFEEPKQR